jgi:DNA-binding response OmpR family regulator
VIPKSPKVLAIGADAYVTKPFSTKELVAKVKSMLGASLNLSVTVNGQNMAENSKKIVLEMNAMKAKHRFALAVVVLGLLMTGPFVVTSLLVWLDMKEAERNDAHRVCCSHACQSAR